MEQGITQARTKSFITVPEPYFLGVDPAAVPLYRSDVGSDGNGWSVPQNWVTHTADGRLLTESAALTGEEGLVSRDWSPTYGLMLHVLRHTLGEPSSNTLIDGGTRRKYVWTDAEGRPNAIETVNGYYGHTDSAYRGRGGKLRAWNLDARRGATGGDRLGGSIEYHFNAYDRNVQIPGASAHSAKYRIKKNGATGAVSLAVGVRSGAAPAQGEVHRLTGSAVNERVVLYDTVDFDPNTMDAAALQSAIRDKAGVYATANVTGSVGAAGDKFNVDLVITFPAGSGNIPALPREPGYGYTATTQLPYNPGGWVYGTVTFAANATAAEISGVLLPNTAITDVEVYRAGTLVPYNEATDDAFDIVIVAPANTPVTINKIGGNRWSTEMVALGSAGTELVYDNTPYMENDHWRAFIAKEDDELAAIDVHDLPLPDGTMGDHRMLKTAVGVNFSYADLVNIFYSGTGKRYATDFVFGARTVAASIILPENNRAGSDNDWLWTTQEDCAATGFWTRFWSSCGGYEYGRDLFGGRQDAVGFETDTDVSLQTFPIGRRRNPSGGGSLIHTLILPV
jgi:hypothetical protein